MYRMYGTSRMSTRMCDAKCVYLAQQTNKARHEVTQVSTAHEDERYATRPCRQKNAVQS